MLSCSHVSCTTEKVYLNKKSTMPHDEFYCQWNQPQQRLMHWPSAARKTSLEKMMIFFKLKAELKNLIRHCWNLRDPWLTIMGQKTQEEL